MGGGKHTMQLEFRKSEFEQNPSDLSSKSLSPKLFVQTVTDAPLTISAIDYVKAATTDMSVLILQDSSEFEAKSRIVLTELNYVVNETLAV